MKAVGAERIGEVAIAGALAGWVALTAVSQHPNRTFDRFRRRDPLGVMIPNWRFFAPDPAVHDFRLMYRYLHGDDATEWIEPLSIPRRTWLQGFWFPGRRRDKGLIDICGEFITYLQIPGLDLAGTPAYRLLRDFVGDLVAEAAGEELTGFQFLVLRHTGYDEEPEPDYLFASRFERWPVDVG